MTTRTNSLVVLLLVALGLTAAAKKSPFDVEYEAGIDAFNLAHYDEAFRHFASARDLEPKKPGPQRWLGRTARVLERWDDCLAAARQALILNPSSPQAGEVRKDVELCRAGLGRPAYRGSLSPGQGALAVLADPGATVVVDGIRKGVTPVDPFPLNAGHHEVTVSRSGTAPLALSTDVLPGIVTDLVAVPSK